MKPMLASKFEEHRVEKQLPVYAQPKLDGIRMLVREGVGYSRSLKPIPNRYVQSEIKRCAERLEGFDGELIIGNPTDPDCYRKTNSAVMSHSGEPGFHFHVFDLWDQYDTTFIDRILIMQEWMETIGKSNPVSFLSFLECRMIGSLNELAMYEGHLLSDGHEGVILRGPSSHYKFGRATPAQGQLIKVKRFTDAEARVVGFEELMHNGNAAMTNELGYAAHSAHKDGMVPMNTLGALICEYCMDDGTADREPWFVEFKVGTGFDQATRQEIWDNQDDYLGRAVKFKYFATGVKDAPRHPVFLGWRNLEDIS